MRLVSSAPLVLVVTLAACFESGPLASRQGSLADDSTSSVDDALVTTTTAPDLDTSEPEDATAPSDSAVASETMEDVVVDTTPETADTATDTSPDVEVRACLIDADCTGIAALDKCGGKVACVDYGCRQDPSTAVHCQRPVGGDACIDVACNPDSGSCEEVELCTCAPALALGCGQHLDFSTSDPEAVDHFSSYACGPPAGPWVEQLVGFSPSAGRVRIDLQSAGTTGFHVLALDGDRCHADTGCVTGAVDRVYFDAAARPYVIALDYVAAQALVGLSATCGITSETECDDGLDDDGDQLVDCADPDCNGVGGCPLILTNEAGHCNNALDDDADQLTDCEDPDCAHDGACLETCQFFTSPVVGCGFHQGSTTGGGTAHATHYSCSPTPAPGKETVYRFRPSFNGPVQVAFSSVPGVAVYLLQDTGQGCTPRDCLMWGSSGFTFQAVEGATYYFDIDTAAGVTGNYDLHVTCD